MKWCIAGGGLPEIYVFAETYDEAFGRDVRLESEGGFTALGWLERC